MTSSMLLLCLLLPAHGDPASVFANTSECDCMAAFTSTSEPLKATYLTKALAPGTRQELAGTTEYIHTYILTCILITSETVGKYHKIKHVIFP